MLFSIKAIIYLGLKDKNVGCCMSIEALIFLALVFISGFIAYREINIEITFISKIILAVSLVSFLVNMPNPWR